MNEVNFCGLVLSYKTAPVAIREQVSLNEAEAKRLMHFLQENAPATDILVVSTCNRTEVYYSAPHDLSATVFAGLRLVRGVESSFEQYFATLSGNEAVRHLFEVTIGLDAQVVGDFQISGQVKKAYQWSADENMAGPYLHRLMHTIFFCNKRVVQETSFRDGAASLSYAAKDLTEDLTAHLREPKVLLVGVGEIGQDVCLNLANSRIKDVTILNRTVEKARQLAEQAGFQYGSLELLKEKVLEADVVISSISTHEPLIVRSFFDSHPILTHKYFIDLSMPRSIDPTIDAVAGAVVYNLDDIQEKTNEALEKRQASIPAVRTIISEAIVEFQDWSKEMIVSPTIQKLKQALEQIRKEELARYLKNSDEKEQAKLEELSKSLVQKFMKLPVLQLKAACKRGDAESLVEVLHELFNLEKTTAAKGHK